jgi:hypothetical protein
VDHAWHDGANVDIAFKHQSNHVIYIIHANNMQLKISECADNNQQTIVA